MTPLKIGLDFDGVIMDNTKMKAAQIKQSYGISLLPRVFNRSFTAEGAPRGLTRWQYIEAKREVYWRPRSVQHMIPIPGAIDCIRQLLTAGHKIVVICSRSRRSAGLVREWLCDHGLPLAVEHVGMRNDDKSEAARKHALDVFVDNDLAKLRKLDGVVPHKILFTWYDNFQQDEDDEALRVIGWYDLRDAIERLCADP